MFAHKYPIDLDEEMSRSKLVLQRRLNVPLRESFVAQGLLRQLPEYIYEGNEPAASVLS